MTDEEHPQGVQSTDEHLLYTELPEGGEALEPTGDDVAAETTPKAQVDEEVLQQQVGVTALLNPEGVEAEKSSQQSHAEDLLPEESHALATELAAVEAGHEPLREQAMADLGDSSFTNELIVQAQEAVASRHDNLRFLRNFTDTLPHANAGERELRGQRFSLSKPYCLGTFGFSGEDMQYKAKQIQAHVLWLETDTAPVGSRTAWPSVIPYFVLGRRPNSKSDRTLDILIVPASGSIYPDGKPVDVLPTIVRVSRADFTTFEKTAEVTSGIPFAENDVEKLVSPVSGRLVVASDTPGSVGLRPGSTIFGRSDRGTIEKRGIRRIPRKSEVLKNGIDSTILKDFDAYFYMSKLAEDFGIENLFKAMIKTRVER